MSEGKGNELNVSSQMDDITPDERTHIDKLRCRMKGLMNKESYEDDRLFRRFLRARNFNINAAEEMLKKNLEWRKKNNVDTILVDYSVVPIVDKYFAYSHFGYDKVGDPLAYCDFGNMDFRGILKCIEMTDLVRHFIWMYETDIQNMKEQSAKVGRIVEKTSFIYNCENLSLRTITNRPTLECLSRSEGVFDDNYPESLKYVYLLNVPVYFSLFWAVFSPFLSEVTLKKIKIFGKDNMSWKGELLKIIDADVLPAFLGGNRTDPDGNPECKTFIKYGEPIPEIYYSSKIRSDFCSRSDTKKLTIARKSKEEIILHVELPTSKIEYEFYVKNKDITFSVLYNKNESNLDAAEEFIPEQKIQTDFTSEAGIFLCEKSGIYILVFDNTYSLIHQKEVYYTATVVSPNDQKLFEE